MEELTNDVERRRLAGSVWSKEREDRISRDTEADLVDDAIRLPKGLDYIEHFERIVGGGDRKSFLLDVIA